MNAEQVTKILELKKRERKLQFDLDLLRLEIKDLLDPLEPCIHPTQALGRTSDMRLGQYFTPGRPYCLMCNQWL